MEMIRFLRRSHRRLVIPSWLGPTMGVVDVVRTVPYEGTEAGSAPVTSTIGHEKSALTRGDNISNQIL